MRKFNVTIKILYDYVIEMPQEGEEEETTAEIVDFCDKKDPVFKEICKIFQKYNIGFDSYVKEVSDANTYEDIYYE